MSEGVGFLNVTFTIGNGASLSDGINIKGVCPIGLLMPAAWTSAGITFQFSPDGTTYGNVFDKAHTELALTTPASTEYILLKPADFAGVCAMKVRSGTSGTPVNQGAARSIIVVCRVVE